MKVPSPAYRQEESRFVEPALFLSASRSPLNPWVQGLRLASKASVRRKHSLRPIRLKIAHRAIFLTPNPHLPRRKSHLNPWVQGLRLAAQAVGQGEATLTPCRPLRMLSHPSMSRLRRIHPLRFSLVCERARTRKSKASVHGSLDAQSPAA